MTSRLPALLSLLILCALLLLAGRWVPQTETERASPDPAARSQPFLVLARLAALAGAEVRSLAAMPEELPPASAALWLPIPGQMLGSARSQALTDWVRAGGNLILVPVNPAFWREDDPLLQAAGAIPGERSVAELAHWFGEDVALHTSPRLPYSFDDGGRQWRLEARFENTRIVEALPGHTGDGLCDPAGCRLLTRALGNGRISLLADHGPFVNAAIGNSDHAWLALRLTGAAPGRVLWIVQDPQVPGLPALVWHHGQAAVLLLLTLVAAWAWRASIRFGPSLPSPQPARRRLGEHLEASGLLLARENAHDALWQACLDDFRRRAEARHPQTRGLDDNALEALLARHLGREPAALRATLHPAIKDDATLAYAVRELEILRRSL